MHPLNPFLRAFLRSTIPGQCVPIENHILLVPTTECLIGSRDRESNIYYSEFVASEEFLGSHVLRIPVSNTSTNAKDEVSTRDNRGKAKQVATVNGRTVIIKENSVYSNKGFKSLAQAQLLSDVLYHSPGSGSQPWLIYYISRPLIGSFEPGKIISAAVPGVLLANDASEFEDRSNEQDASSSKKAIRSFGELLAHFPMIARQMQPGLERLFREFGKELGKPLPPPPSLSPSLSENAEGKYGREESSRGESASIYSSSSVSRDRLPFNSEEYFEDDEDLMRRSLETAVTAAIDLFRLVDKQQLSLLGATTDLTGPLVERLIERYVAEQVHESLLFARLCDFRKFEDAELDARIRQMENIDVSQVGIVVEGGRKGKRELLQRLSKGVEEFRKMLDAKSPHEMLSNLLEAIKVISFSGSYDEADTLASEKQTPVTINADLLVSLLLVAVIRSQVRHLHARLLYMQHFIYIDDVDSGEMGYALSTFEAVLMYLATDSASLRRASMRNKRLWRATKAGRVSDMKAILESDGDHVSADDTQSMDESKDAAFRADKDAELDVPSTESPSGHSPSTEQNYFPEFLSISKETPPLAHVFPFQTWPDTPLPKESRRPVKKVSMDVGSVSGSSGVSLASWPSAIGSISSIVEGDSSIETLTKTQDPAGDSIPMMAVESCQPESLKYLLSLREYYSVEDILEDTNTDGTTLLNAAIQLAHTDIVDVFLDFLFQNSDESTISSYLKKPDTNGRTVAHYLFSIPSLMSRLGRLLPWTQRDRNGQTPLFALSRSYDHPDYRLMVNSALTGAHSAQNDGKPLRLEDHIDSRGNTLLHIIGDPVITLRILQECDCDPNATNDKKFTPLMMASKYGRTDQVRVLFMDPRVDIYLKEARGLTAVELAKDDEVRNRIDDLILLSNSAMGEDASERVTTVVRSFFVEDATVRFVLKSGVPNPASESAVCARGSTTYTVTTCRRSFSDFENLAKWLSIEHPASYMPTLPNFRSPFQIHSKPSRSVLHCMQKSLDKFLKVLLAHPTFATHEMLWEFFLVPELQPEMMSDRSRHKALALSESISDDYEPATGEGIREIEQFATHAQDMVRAVHGNFRSVIRRGYALQNSVSDLTEALSLCKSVISTLKEPTNVLPKPYVDAFSRYADFSSTASSDSSPLLQFLAVLASIDNTTAAILRALSRPLSLISDITTTNRALSHARSLLASSSLPRKFNLNFPGSEESRQKSVRDMGSKVHDLEVKVNRLSREITWNNNVVVGELAGWTSWREKIGRDAIRSFVRMTLVREKERGKRLERCLRSIHEVDTRARI